MTARTESYLHANAVALGERGLLLRGPSGVGKSALTLALIARFAARGAFARLVGDDRVRVDSQDGRLVARPHPAIEGLIEIRGLGLARVPFERACRLDAVVDISNPGETPPRRPEDAQRSVLLRDVALPRLCVQGCDDVSLERIVFFLQSINAF
ncbi:HPr kinase/phosphatase C-terminal domain-containing protein [Methylocystis sp. IM3]|jgi:serine kinase of HPr protein (carbohydrate metabolism regulator)|uniref:HPr kinase/phosphorylase n=1 Tax=unclassified Methylocystis TaxID=2625913 RepID=UPI000F92C74B|nr:MAG: aldolase [Hyphomicrobiales bacterium]